MAGPVHVKINTANKSYLENAQRFKIIRIPIKSYMCRARAFGDRLETVWCWGASVFDTHTSPWDASIMDMAWMGQGDAIISIKIYT